MNHIHFNFYCYNVVFLYTYLTFFAQLTSFLMHLKMMAVCPAGILGTILCPPRLCVRQVSTIV